jgi:hypothetical protein
MTKRPAEEITDHEDPEMVTRTIAYHALPYPFGDQSAQSMYMWCVEQVLQHPETPLTDKTRAFIKDLFGDILAAGSEVQKPRIEVVK